MIPINSQLLELIENEILQNDQSTYQRIIPINEYTFETKKTLDILVEKYGGFVNRYDDKIIIFINYTTANYHAKPTKETVNFTENFEKVNTILNRLNTLEEKIDYIIEEQNKLKKDATKNFNSYMNYFKPNEKKREFSHLVDEIISHH